VAQDLELEMTKVTIAITDFSKVKNTSQQIDIEK
jgi:hypothetical protein